MLKLLTGSLMLALSAFSFFSYAEFSEDSVLWVEPKVASTGQIGVNCSLLAKCINDSSLFDNVSDALAFVVSQQPDNVYLVDEWSRRAADFPCNQSANIDCTTEMYYKGVFRYTANSAWYQQVQPTLYLFADDSKTCPPDANPDYTRGPMPVSSENPEHLVCFSKFPTCPLGYFKFSVEPYGCVQIQCPAKGQGVNDITTHGKLPFGQSGTFCDGTCSYSVSAGASSYDGARWATGVSNGAVCGNGKVESKANFTPEDKEGDCTTHTLSNGLTYQDCVAVSTPDEGGEESVDPGTDSTDNEVDETEVDSPFSGMDCGTVNNKEVCVGKNIVDAIQDQNNKLKKDAAERHNKLVDQQKEISDYVESKNKERELARVDDARQVINGLKEVKKAIVAGVTGGGGSSNAGVISAIKSLGKDIGETDVETDGVPSDGIESFYEPEYPNGFEDVWNKNKTAFDSSAPVTYIKQWEVSVGGNAPDMNMCFDLGSMANFGCKTFEIDPRVFPFLRIIILLSTAFLCRALVMGG